MAQQGAAADYYQDGQQSYAPPPGPPPGQEYQPQPNYSQHAANYGYQPPQYAPEGEKQDFNQTFKIEKPKWNDLWAGLLLILVFFGFAAVSGYSISGLTKNESGGIYGNTDNFGLNNNTILLFTFVIVTAIVLSFAYLFLARTFPKVSRARPTDRLHTLTFAAIHLDYWNSKHRRGVCHRNLLPLAQIVGWRHCVPAACDLHSLLLYKLDS